MLRWPSGVTAIRQQAVCAPSLAVLGVVIQADCFQAFGETLAQPVGLDLAHEDALAAEGGQARHGVRGRAAGNFAALGQHLQQLMRAKFVDQASSRPWRHCARAGRRRRSAAITSTMALPRPATSYL